MTPQTKIPFSLELYNTGNYRLACRDERCAKIDRIYGVVIYGQVSNKYGKVFDITWMHDGTCYTDMKYWVNLDLFLIPIMPVDEHVAKMNC